MVKPADWLAESRVDLEGAEVLGQHGLYALACFHCQQAVEKAPKGLLLAKSKPVPKSHSIAELAEKSCVFADFRDVAGAFDTDYSLTRYIDATGKPTGALYDREMFSRRFHAANKAVKKVEGWIRS